MKSLVFPYKTYKHVHYPIIPLEIQAGPIRRKTDAYVDSGASFSIFSIHEAKRLKLDYRKGKKILVTVGFGRSMPVWLHKLSLKIGNISLKATIGFSPTIDLSFNLLGRKDIFTFFDVTFSDSARRISFRRR